MTTADTIAAIASPLGRGAVGVIRVSGAAVPRIAIDLMGALPPPRHARLARIVDGDGNSLDRGLAVYFPAPASFTGEHVLEFHGHGGALVMDLVLQRILALGCRLARPGEFSERAFWNGKIDVAQAEAVADLIDAGTAAAARAAVRSMQGEFSARINQLQSEVTELRAYVEAAIDFPDEEIDFLADAALGGRLNRLFAGFESIIAAASQGALLREGLTVVIAGKPNAGKSSVLNRLVGDEVAIVTEQPGTTRDVLRQHLHLDGLPLNLVDTAGLRCALDPAEAEGIRRARAEIGRADRILYVVDASLAEAGMDSHTGEPTGAAPAANVDHRDVDGAAPAANSDRDGFAGVANAAKAQFKATAADRIAAELAELPPNVPVTLVFNKIDLTRAAARAVEDALPPRIYLSARSGAGMNLLRAHLKSSAGYRESDAGAFSARRRHLDALGRARERVHSAARVLRDSRAVELFAEELRLAQRALGEITGEFTSEDLLGKIFGSFCIGK